MGGNQVSFCVVDFLKESFSIVFKIHTHEWLLGGFWFIKELFLGSFIFYFLLRYVKRSEIILTILLLLTIFFRWHSPDLPFLRFAKMTFLATLFLSLGYFCRNYKVWFVNDKLSIFSLFLITFFGVLANPEDMFSCDYINVILYVFFALSGIFLVLCISEKFEKQGSLLKSFWIYLGERTMCILTFHFLSFKLVSYFVLRVLGEPIERLAEFPVLSVSISGLWIVYTLVGLSLPLCINYIIRR